MCVVNVYVCVCVCVCVCVEGLDVSICAFVPMNVHWNVSHDLM